MIECAREHEVLEALGNGSWDAQSSDLRGHAQVCKVCGEVVTVAGALRAAHDGGCASARVPSAGLVWWRATIRARAEAARTADQAITIAHALGGACLAGVACAVAGSVWNQLPALPHVSGTVLLALGLGACVVFTPLALVLTLSKD
jgi:hypothetical protein